METRPEIDKDRIGVSGRSGGGMYSWFLLALDERIKTGTQTAGITDLRDHLLKGVITGHCNCNYWNNFHRLDTTAMAALAAPRPVRLLNSDRDNIFPLSGIRRIEKQVANVYALYGKEGNWDVAITQGGHSDSPELQRETYTWMIRWLTGAEIEDVPEAKPLFEPEQLRVLSKIPADERNTSIDEIFLPKADTPAIPQSRWEWERMKNKWMRALMAKPFAGWPAAEPDAKLVPVLETEIDGRTLQAATFSPQPGIELRTWIFANSARPPKRLVIRILDNASWPNALAAFQSAVPDRTEEIVGPGAHASAWPEPNPAAWAEIRSLTNSGAVVMLLAPRGVGPTFYEDPKRSHLGDTITRSFPMLGQTLAGMQIWDLRTAVHAVRQFSACHFAVKMHQ